MNPNTKLGILMVTPQISIGGAENQVVNMAISLRKKGHHVIVYSNGGEFGKKITENGILSLIGPIHSKNPLKLLKCIFSIRQILKDHHVDIIHSHAVFPSIVCWLARARESLVMTGHGWPEKNMWIISRLLNLTSDKIIAISNKMYQEYIRNGIDPNKLAIIFNSVDSNIFNTVDDKKTKGFRESLSLNKSDIVIGIVARLRDYRKGHLILLRVMKEIIKKHKNVKLLIVGDGLLKGEITKYASDLQLGPNVIFTGEQLDTPCVFSALDIVALPSEREGLPIVILEGMAAAKPVVASRIDGIVDVVLDNQTGLLFNKYDEQELFFQLCKLIESRELREQMGKLGKQRISQNFSLSSNMEKIESLYYEVLKK